MEAFNEVHVLHTFDDEPMVMGRSLRGVSLLEPTLPFPAYHLGPLVPLFMDLKTGSERSKIYSTNMDLYLGSVSTVSKNQAYSNSIDDAVTTKLTNFH